MIHEAMISSRLGMSQIFVQQSKAEIALVLYHLLARNGGLGMIQAPKIQAENPNSNV